MSTVSTTLLMVDRSDMLL